MTLLQFVLIQLNLLVLFGLYKWLAARKGQLQFNRVYLLLGPAIAIILPFVSFEQTQKEVLSVMLPAIEVINETGAQYSESFNLLQLLISIIGMGMIALLAISLVKVVAPKKSHYLEHYRNYPVFLLEDDGATTHSIFNRIYLHPSHLEHKEVVLEHEFAHCKSKHSFDLLIMALYKTVFWFNPVVYLWSREMQLNHEYLADAHVLSKGVSPRYYGEVLVDLNFTCGRGALVNSFNQPSSLRKRIIQFNHKNKFNMKHLIIIPAIAALAFATTSLTVTPDAPTAGPLTKITGESESDPQFPGGQEALMEYIMNAITYPKELIKDGAEGKVFVKFVVTKEGKVTNVHAVRGSGHKEMDAEAIRVIKNMPDWEPGKKDGKAVDSEMTIPIAFAL